jgi:hypothetical protein
MFPNSHEQICEIFRRCNYIFLNYLYQILPTCQNCAYMRRYFKQLSRTRRPVFRGVGSHSLRNHSRFLSSNGRTTGNQETLTNVGGKASLRRHLWFLRRGIWKLLFSRKWRLWCLPTFRKNVLPLFTELNITLGTEAARPLRIDQTTWRHIPWDWFSNVWWYWIRPSRDRSGEGGALQNALSLR